MKICAARRHYPLLVTESGGERMSDVARELIIVE